MGFGSTEGIKTIEEPIGNFGGMAKVNISFQEQAGGSRVEVKDFFELSVANLKIIPYSAFDNEELMGLFDKDEAGLRKLFHHWNLPENRQEVGAELERRFKSSPGNSQSYNRIAKITENGKMIGFIWVEKYADSTLRMAPYIAPEERGKGKMLKAYTTLAAAYETYRGTPLNFGTTEADNIPMMKLFEAAGLTRATENPIPAWEGRGYKDKPCHIFTRHP